MTNDEKKAMKELYEMVGEGKRLLMRWSATSRLTPEGKLQLRRDTHDHARRSSTNLIKSVWPIPSTKAEELEVVDIRDAALKGITQFCEDNEIEVMVAMSQLRFGVVYITGQTRFVVEVHKPS
jgi:hypothetical protein